MGSLWEGVCICSFDSCFKELSGFVLFLYWSKMFRGLRIVWYRWISFRLEGEMIKLAFSHFGFLDIFCWDLVPIFFIFHGHLTHNVSLFFFRLPTIFSICYQNSIFYSLHIKRESRRREFLWVRLRFWRSILRSPQLVKVKIKLGAEIWWQRSRNG